MIAFAYGLASVAPEDHQHCDHGGATREQVDPARKATQGAAGRLTATAINVGPRNPAGRVEGRTAGGWLATPRDVALEPGPLRPEQRNSAVSRAISTASPKSDRLRG